MTLSITASACAYTGDGSTVAFDVRNGADGIYFATASELTVTLRSGTTITAQSIGTHYTVSGAASSSGIVTFLTAPANGVEVRIERNTPYTQSLALANAGAFNPANIMGALDKAVRMVQDIDRRVDRAVTQYPDEYDANGALLLPRAEAGHFLGWNAGGTALENKDAAEYTITVGTVTTGAAGSSAVATITGTAEAGVLNLTIPRGDTGASGAGTGDVIGPAGATANALVLFDGTSGTSIKDSGYTITAAGAALLDDAAASNQRTTLGLGIGTDVQAYDGDLAEIAGLTFAQGDLIYHNASQLTNLAAGTAGYLLTSGGAGANLSWTVPWSIAGLTAETAPALADTVPIYDASATAEREMTLPNLLNVINLLTEDTTPDTAADFLLTYDTSASEVKKAKPQNVANSIWVLIGSTTIGSAVASVEHTWTAGAYSEVRVVLSDISGTATTPLTVDLRHSGGSLVAKSSAGDFVAGDIITGAFGFQIGLDAATKTYTVIGYAAAASGAATNDAGVYGSSASAADRVRVSFNSGNIDDGRIYVYGLKVA